MFLSLYFVFMIFVLTIAVPIILLPNVLIMKCLGYEINIWRKFLSFPSYAKMLNTTHDYHPDSNELVDSGFILPNHRTWVDFCLDPYIAKASILGRVEAWLAISFASLICYFEKMIIVINKKDDRHTTFSKMINHMNSKTPGQYNKRIIFYPEGKRCSYISCENIDDVKSKLKPGLLKSVYEYKLQPIQLMITNNKEKFFNEKKLSVGFNIHMTTYISKPIHPTNYSNFEDFYTAIATEWFTIWNKVYEDQKPKSDYWLINNKKYKFSENFIKSHPGGQRILEQTKNSDDLSALFHTYHAFSNTNAIKQQLETFEIEETKSIETIKDYKLYNELIKKIKNETTFKKRNDIKINFFYIVQNMFVTVLYTSLIYFVVNDYFNWFLSPVIMFLCGCLWMSLMFNVLHDASHYAISKSPKVNELLSSITASFSLWNHTIWFYHHVFYHHSFTNQENDPDVYHYNPFANKKESKNRGILGSYSNILLPLVTILFPGFYVGQIISYIIGRIKGKVFRVKLPNHIKYLSVLELVFYFLIIYTLSLTSMLNIVSYFFALNIMYHINIVGDHDTFESHVENKYTGNDFLKLQVQNSSNFCINSKFWTHFFGGINYQIEHHLFPNMCHKHYPIIAPIVKQFCDEHNIPYIVHNSIFDVYLSFLKMIKYYSYSTIEVA
jgi:linoleoyl-CoA desaturase